MSGDTLLWSESSTPDAFALVRLQVPSSSAEPGSYPHWARRGAISLSPPNGKSWNAARSLPRPRPQEMAQTWLWCMHVKGSGSGGWLLDGWEAEGVGDDVDRDIGVVIVVR